MRISEALEVLQDFADDEFITELRSCPPDYWLVEGDEPKPDGTPHMFIVENSPENDRIFLQHKPINLS